MEVKKQRRRLYHNTGKSCNFKRREAYVRWPVLWACSVLYQIDKMVNKGLMCCRGKVTYHPFGIFPDEGVVWLTSAPQFPPDSYFVPLGWQLGQLGRPAELGHHFQPLLPGAPGCAVPLHRAHPRLSALASPSPFLWEKRETKEPFP